MATLDQLREDKMVILTGTSGQLPVAFEVRKVVDIGGRFRGAKTFVEDVVTGLPDFYREVGQHLQVWVPKAPKIKVTPEPSETEVLDTEPVAPGRSDRHDPGEPDDSISAEAEAEADEIDPHPGQSPATFSDSSDDA